MLMLMKGCKDQLVAAREKSAGNVSLGTASLNFANLNDEFLAAISKSTQMTIEVRKPPNHE